MDLNLELLKKLCEIPGVSGHEEPIRQLVKAELAVITDEITEDKLGNVISYKKATKAIENRLKVMVAAHMDEIGFLIKHIDQDGFLRFIPLGGFDPQTLIAQRVIIHGSKDIKGIIAPRPLWLVSDDTKKNAPEIKDLFIDVGMNKEEVSKYVRVGNIVSLDQDFMELNSQVVTSRNFDDRLGVFVMIEALKRIKECSVDIYAVGTVQEELGLRGGIVASFNVEPDIGIAIDGSLASDIPNIKEEDRHCSLGGGAGIYLIDNKTVSDSKIVNFMIELTKKYNIKYQFNIGGGTDAGAMQRSKKGCRVCTIGPPIRYMHSVVQLAHLVDIENTIEMLKTFLENAHRL